MQLQNCLQGKKIKLSHASYFAAANLFDTDVSKAELVSDVGCWTQMLGFWWAFTGRRVPAWRVHLLHLFSLLADRNAPPKSCSLWIFGDYAHQLYLKTIIFLSHICRNSIEMSCWQTDFVWKWYSTSNRESKTSGTRRQIFLKNDVLVVTMGNVCVQGHKSEYTSNWIKLECTGTFKTNKAMSFHAQAHF